MLGSLARNPHYGQPPFLPEVQQHPVEKRYYVTPLLKINMNLHPIHKRNQVSVKKESRLFRSNVYPLHV